MVVERVLVGRNECGRWVGRNDGRRQVKVGAQRAVSKRVWLKECGELVDNATLLFLVLVVGIDGFRKRIVLVDPPVGLDVPGS